MKRGDMPCHHPCTDTLCHYNLGGVCMDNCPCKPLDADGNERKEDTNG